MGGKRLKIPKGCVADCTICKKSLGPIQSLPDHRRLKAIRNIPMVCSDVCRRVLSSRTMAHTNTVYASDRMKNNNPMSMPETRKKVSTTLKKMGHKPSIIGGNGRGPTVYEQMLADMLGATINFVVKTKQPRNSGYPTVYKIDVAIPEHKIGIEVDGFSHNCIERRKQDQKKTNFLRGLGWTVHRLLNKDVESLCAPIRKNV